MKYTSKSLKYVFANFGYLVLFGLFPAVFLAYSLDTATVGAILRDYFTGSPYASFSDIFHAVSIFNFHSVSATIADVLSVILAVTCVAMMMAFMEKRTIVREQFVSMTIAEILIGLVCVFAPWAWLKLVLNSAVFAGQILLFVTRMQVVYFDRAQLERADEKNYYFG